MKTLIAIVAAILLVNGIVDAQSLQYSVPLKHPEGVRYSSVAEFLYDGKGGGAFTVTYQNAAFTDLGKKLFWVNSKKQLVTLTIDRNHELVRLTKTGAFFQLSNGTMKKLVRDKNGNITETLFGSNESIQGTDPHDFLGFFTIVPGQFAPSFLNCYAN